MKNTKLKKLKKVEKFNESLAKTLDSMSQKLKKSKKKVMSAPRVRVNKNIILLKTSDTDEIVELINPIILVEKDDPSEEGQKLLAISYNSKEGKVEKALLTKEDSKVFLEEYNYLLKK